MAEKIVWLEVTRPVMSGSSDTCVSSSSINSDDDDEDASSTSSSKLSKDNSSVVTLISVKIREGETVKSLTARVVGILGLNNNQTGWVLQLRNARDSLIPLNGKLEENTKETAYKLTVVTEHCRVTPKARSIYADIYSSTINSRTQMFLSRINNLENFIPELHVKREEKIKKEISELEDKLNFLEKRFNEADKMEWTGIIKKSPLW